MGRRPCCSKEGLNRGAWSAREDMILSDYIRNHGEGKWRDLPKRAGLKRCGKSCRLRWLNYLRPDIKRGNISEDEENLIIKLHALLGNRWSLIAGRLPGRTDNEIKNYWNTNLSKKTNAPPQLASKRLGKGELGPADRKMEPAASGGERPSYVVRAKAVRCTKVYIPSVPSLPATATDNNVCYRSLSTASKTARDAAGEAGGFRIEDFDVEEFMIGFDENDMDILQEYSGGGAAHDVGDDSIWLCDAIMQQDQLGASCGDSCCSASRLAAEVQTLASLIDSAEEVQHD